MQTFTRKTESENAQPVTITGWVQDAGGRNKPAIVDLQLQIGGLRLSYALDMTADDFVKWCKHHKFDCADFRRTGESAA